MKDLKFQQKAVRELVDKTIDLLCLPGNRKQLVFKAPTGSGKTVMTSQLLSDLTEELQSRGDCPVQQVAYMWIAPNKLHQQSYFKMKDFFHETHLLRAVMYDELDHSEGYIKPGEILFVNWESINKEKNIIVRDNEQNASVFEITRRTQEEHGLPIILVIDEEHLFWSKTADKSKKVLEQIQPKVEIRVSATPKTYSDNIVNIPREKVIEEEMIKKQVILNPDIDERLTDEHELNQHLIACAIRKREQLAEAYRELGVKINPLLLIQLPNDTSESMTAEDTRIADQVRTYLDKVKGINQDNGKLAVWLSNEKSNLENLEDLDNVAEALLFKQAIALGWDCPRAAVLLIFRKLTSSQFTIQTVGRILRMPEQRFYTNNLLNVGYVYTDISKDKIEIVADDMDYLEKNCLQAIRRDNLQNISLQSYYSERKSSDRNRLGPDFRKVLMESFQELWSLSWQPSLFDLWDDFDVDDSVSDPEQPETGPETTASINQQKLKNIIRFDVKNVNVEIPANVVFQNEVGVINTGERYKFARSSGELHRIYIDFCRSQLTHFEKSHSTDVLAGYLLSAMEELFELFETDAKKVILYHANKPRFVDVIQKALSRYERILEERRQKAKERGFERYDWEIPEERLYNVSSHQVITQVKDHALIPFVELNDASNPEQRFRMFLEANKEYIDWWYKNGDEGKQHYSIPYVRSNGDNALFYVDFIIRMKNGQVFLFDTKSANSDGDAPQKHNALIDYMCASERAENNLKGGILIENKDVWYYSSFHIDNTNDIVGWNAFFPQDYNT
ncbi:MAG: DEAD/DEAH box helicase family protein [Bacteroidaceae bacterium]|nr:DEAD/DEAH box helicase family protein [Bacteroidaceae bacterium]